MEIYVRSKFTGSNKRKALYLPERFFYLVIKADPGSPLPLTVTVTEDHNPIISIAGLRVPPHPPSLPQGQAQPGIVNLSVPTVVAFIGNPLVHYKINSLGSFKMKYKAIQVRGKMSGNVKKAKYFKGSKMKVTVKNDATVLHEETINVNVSNPNNHYHLRGERKFLDGWYFKCVHVDKINKKATPFFFLYGINKDLHLFSGAPPAPGPNDIAFVLYGNAGSINMDPTMVKAKVGKPGPVPTNIMLKLPTSGFEAEKEYGLNTKIKTDFAATDVSCRGKNTLPLVEWKLTFTKIHNSVVTDFNPLYILDENYIPYAIIRGYEVHEDKARPLMRYVKKGPDVSAYYMSHNMNSLVSGTIKWVEGGVDKTYTFDNDKGYQDENWGSSGFPHPYVWMQANNFRNSTDNPLPGMSMIALFTPGMPMADGDLSEIGSICFRKSQTAAPVRFTHADSQGPWDSLWEWLGDKFAGLEIGTMTCKVTFAESNGSGVVKIDMLTATEASLTAALGSFSTRTKKPIKYNLTGENDNGDKIDIEVTCDYQTQMELSAPKKGVFTAKVTKQSIHGKFKVKFTPKGESTTTYYSDFGTVDFGD
ncbi:MAG: hypothetical protein KAI50_07070 [Desulfobacterales bacterium]|nr:hypothetical protein [Desulfobacterales bacterium]